MYFFHSNKKQCCDSVLLQTTFVVLFHIFISCQSIHHDLFVGIKTGNSTLIKQALKSGANPNLPLSEKSEVKEGVKTYDLPDCHYYLTPLMAAIYYNQEISLKTLIDNKADINDRLSLPYIYGHKLKMNAWTDRGNRKKIKGCPNEMIWLSAYITPLHYSLFLKHYSQAKLLINSGAEVNQPTIGYYLHQPYTKISGISPLHIAIRDKNRNIIEVLLKHDADPNQMERLACSNGDSPLIMAAQQGNITLAKLLLKHGAKINLSNDVSTPLLNATYSEEMAFFLIKNGASIKDKTDRGETLLHLAARSNVKKLFLYLLKEAKLDPNAGTLWHGGLFHHDPEFSDGNSAFRPLHYAVLEEQTKKIELLVEYGANIEAKTNRGWTPLFYAVMSGKIKSVIKLHKLGANIHTRLPVEYEYSEFSNNKFLTPLHLAVHRENQEMVITLLKLGANKNLKDSKGLEPIDYARIIKNNTIEKILQKNK